VARLPEHQTRIVAVEAGADPRSVRKVLAGEPVRPLTAARVVQALKRLDLAHLLPGVAAPKG
jgi:hypothetical protein